MTTTADSTTTAILTADRLTLVRLSPDYPRGLMPGRWSDSDPLPEDGDGRLFYAVPSYAVGDEYGCLVMADSDPRAGSGGAGYPWVFGGSERRNTLPEEMRDDGRTYYGWNVERRFLLPVDDDGATVPAAPVDEGEDVTDEILSTPGYVLTFAGDRGPSNAWVTTGETVPRLTSDAPRQYLLWVFSAYGQAATPTAYAVGAFSGAGVKAYRASSPHAGKGHAIHDRAVRLAEEYGSAGETSRDAFRRGAASVREEWEAWKVMATETAHNYADRNDLCGEFDRCMAAIGLPGRPRTWQVNVSGYVLVNADSADTAERLVRDAGLILDDGDDEIPSHGVYVTPDDAEIY